MSAEKKQILSLDKVLTKIRLLFIKMALPILSFKRMSASSKESVENLLLEFDS